MILNFNKAQLPKERLEGLQAVVGKLQENLGRELAVWPLEFPKSFTVFDAAEKIADIKFNMEKRVFEIVSEQPQKQQLEQTQSVVEPEKKNVQVTVDDLQIGKALVDMFFSGLEKMSDAQRVAAHQEFSRRIFTKFFSYCSHGRNSQN